MATAQNDKKLADARKAYDQAEQKFKDIAREIEDARLELDKARRELEDAENDRPGARESYRGTRRPGGRYRGARGQLFSRAIDTGFGLFEATVIGTAEAAARLSDEVSGLANDLASDWRYDPYYRR